MNVKRAAALVASAIGVLLLAALVGLGHVANPASVPAKATLAAHIYGDGTASIYGDGLRAIYGDGTSSVTAGIYGD